MRKPIKNRKGFTLIEILLVVVIIGIMLAVIVPRAWRANIDAKYGLVRQAASEMASFGQEWTEQQMIAQAPTDDTNAMFYHLSLAGSTGTSNAGVWVANSGTNWSGATASVTPVGRSNAPETTVAGIVPPEKHPRNPFNGASYFVSANDATSNVIPGALAFVCNYESNPTAHYFAFLFQGTDSTTTTIIGSTTTFHAGQDSTMPGLRNGIFFSRTMQ